MIIKQEESLRTIITVHSIKLQQLLQGTLSDRNLPENGQVWRWKLKEIIRMGLNYHPCHHANL